MRIPFLLSLALILFHLCACKSDDKSTDQKEETATTNATSETYSKNGISFSLPPGWTLAESPIPGEDGAMAGTYIMVEKEGDDESGQFIASLLNTKIPLANYLDLLKEELSRNLSLQKSSITFSDISKEDYNGFNAMACKFEHDAVELNFRGELKAFYCGGKTVHIFTQEERGDAVKNKPGFDLLLNSFTCNF